MPIAKEQFPQIITDNNINSVTDARTLLGDVSGIEEKDIPRYSRWMGTRDIHDQLQDIYGIEMSAAMVSKSTDKILPEIREWQSRPLNPVCPLVFMDCIHYNISMDGKS